MGKSIYIDENGNEQILSSSPSALSGLLDTDITTPTANQVLAYDGDNWVNTDVDTTLDTSSTNPIANGTVAYSLANRVQIANGTGFNITHAEITNGYAQARLFDLVIDCTNSNNNYKRSELNFTTSGITCSVQDNQGNWSTLWSNH